MNALEFREVRFSHDARKTCLDQVSFALEEGCSSVLLGPNGAGKSTIMALALGYLKPSGGEILLFGKPLGSYNRKVLGSLVGYVSQSGGVSFNYSVIDYVLLGRASRISPLGTPGAADRKAAREAIETAGIGFLAERKVLELSAGEMQMASVARCLAQEPRLVLLDEPTSHLDPARTAGVASLIRRLEESGMTVFFSTHDPHLARLCSRSALLIRQGRILDRGASGEVLDRRRLESLYGTPFVEARAGEMDIPLPDFRFIRKEPGNQ